MSGTSVRDFEALEKLGVVGHDEKPDKRRITAAGQRDLDRIAQTIVEGQTENDDESDWADNVETDYGSRGEGVAHLRTSRRMKITHRLGLYHAEISSSDTARRLKPSVCSK
ncbi:hypothetical protein F5B22DRAFT_647882 [Xylaria bambusicola]|uniref:uncharacterized protein n=1 Tax=Xylaria bambusicola TaxID=326684 RepID=UPI002007D8B9|nr:uncharacterized protein F5B22DRAFT_647882 [Xylaria bambusicola]KAI0513331.1 hypothetical protein F5B22DRAFT_647882 [Xylaria bambusicola]